MGVIKLGPVEGEGVKILFRPLCGLQNQMPDF